MTAAETIKAHTLACKRETGAHSVFVVAWGIEGGSMFYADVDLSISAIIPAMLRELADRIEEQQRTIMESN